MNLEPVLEYLQLERFGIRAKTLFRTNMPADIENGILLVSQTPHTLHPYTGTPKGDFQVIVRGTDEDEVYECALQVSEALNLQGKRMGDMTFHFIRPKHLPLIYPKSVGRVVEGSVNFECNYIIHA